MNSVMALVKLPTLVNTPRRTGDHRYFHGLCNVGIGHALGCVQNDPRAPCQRLRRIVSGDPSFQQFTISIRKRQ
jgi:hypothetical protein